MLDSGEGLRLCPGEIHALDAPLFYRADGQSISTEAATRPFEFATLRIANPAAANAAAS